MYAVTRLSCFRCYQALWNSIECSWKFQILVFRSLVGNLPCDMPRQGVALSVIVPHLESFQFLAVGSSTPSRHTRQEGLQIPCVCSLGSFRQPINQPVSPYTCFYMYRTVHIPVYLRVRSVLVNFAGVSRLPVPLPLCGLR